jgi:hypothetical protein
MSTPAFRRSGRFVWPLCYLLVAGAVLLWRLGAALTFNSGYPSRTPPK